MTKRIVGLLGGAGSGKTTVSNYLVEKHGGVKYAFADPLKEIARRVFDFTHEQLYGSQAQKEAVDPRFGFSPRWLLQKLGTEGIREVLGKDIWWRTCLAKILDEGPDLAVVEDFRFENEVEGFLAINDALSNSDEPRPVMIWRVESPRQSTTADQTHQSEAEWTRCRYTHLLAPAQYGIPHLIWAIDQLVMECNIPKLPQTFRPARDASEWQPPTKPATPGVVRFDRETQPLCLADTSDGPCTRNYGHDGDHERV